MVHAAYRRVLAQLSIVVVAAGVGLAASAPAAQAERTPAARAKPAPAGAAVPAVPGYPPVARQRPAVPKPLHRKAGAVPLKRGTKAARALVEGTDSVRLRALVIAVDAEDFGVATWRSTLDRVGASYDVLYSRTEPLTAATLVGADGVGNYNAVLLTSGGLFYFDGGFFSGLDNDEWNLLWAYERDYGVRQASLYTSYGTWPENYCLTGFSEGGVGDTPLPADLTAAGAEVFDHLTPTAQIPIVQSYVYRTRVAAGCAADPVLTHGDDVLGVRTTSPDGRERLALTFTSNQYLLQADLLVYGVFRWATRGLHLGEQRHFLNVDIDDWFNTADHLYPDGHIETDPGFRVSGHDAYNLFQRQAALRAEHPAAAGFTFSLAYNGGDADLAAGTACAPDGDVETLTATSRCLAADFRWLNHTVTHQELNLTDFAVSRAEIADNFAIAAALGLPTGATVVKTGEYSGLGVYHPDPDNDTDPPTDFGLAASNTDLLAAAQDLGVRYLHGNMSFGSHVPPCFNCAVVHPLNPAVLIVPDWPTNIAYHTTTPEEEAVFYNSFYGPDGRFPYWPANLTYEQLLDYEAGQALGRLASGSAYSNTFHIANVRDYAGGQTLVTDWVDRVLDKYDAYYQVPVLSPDWPALGAYAEARTGHFAALAAGTSVVYDRVAGTLAVSSPAAGTVTVSGAQAPGSQVYGAEVSAPVTVSAGGTVTVTAAPRP
ncbi:MAG TPA: hypothetical protein VFT95_06375 [Micromonosporaceae bacterium]|nr:hypothetical protein [Micromonosporaceae bacterium]